MNTITLRPYQEKCVAAGLHFFKNDRVSKPKIIVAPTAAGKSIIIAAIAAQLPGSVLVLQPSLELLQQNYGKYCLYNTNAAIYSASAGQKKIGKVTFATIGSIVNVAEFFNQFAALIIDECHMFPPNAESMAGKFLEANPQMKILGLTATPFRLKSGMNGAKLVMMHNSNIYNGYAHIIQIQEIAADYWCPLRYVDHTGDTSILVPNTTGAEYTEESLAKFGRSVNMSILDAVELYAGKSKIVFVPSVEQAADLARRTRSAAYVCAKTPKKERAEIISAFKNGFIKTVYNVSVLSVGFDYPGLEVVVDACPTLSLARYYQKIGRLTRPHALKEFATVVDLSGNLEKFGKVEDIELRKIGTSYHIFSGDKQLTGVSFGEPFVPEPISVQVFEDLELTFGKFKGQKISACPGWYLSWCMDNITHAPTLVANIKIFLQNQKAPQLF